MKAGTESPDSRFKLEWTAGKRDQGKLLREFLAEKEISRASLTDIKFNGGSIRVNSGEATVRYRLGGTEHIEVRFPHEELSPGLVPENLPLEIVYEDAYVMVIEKPPGMNTIPSRDRPRGSMANAIAGYYQRIGLASTIHIVTRLDRDTSGLMLIAKHRHVHHLLSALQKEGKVNRYYEAIVHGPVEKDRGFIDAPIGRKDTSIIEREVRDDGQYAYTGYKVIERLQGYTHLKLKLQTGRTHQIRVHLAHIGHPLAGDDLYGGTLVHIARQALHCESLSFYHPLLDQERYFERAIPADMKKLIEWGRT
ncbi:RluA family pseudouridine synthase [Peribacillus kribbensis]|uniref:RluA family pseudouridine synthase n=1 Tax=Peribacillus kribbensis TaxID=356658 RepID=UPI0004225657|nr:RluA family pseudouridine synthase [Peribacillus kribbensis]